MNSKFLNIASFVAVKYQFLYAKVWSILVSLYFRLVPHHFVCSGNGTDGRQIASLDIFNLFFLYS